MKLTTTMLLSLLFLCSFVKLHKLGPSQQSQYQKKLFSNGDTMNQLNNPIQLDLTGLQDNSDNSAEQIVFSIFLKTVCEQPFEYYFGQVGQDQIYQSVTDWITALDKQILPNVIENRIGQISQKGVVYNIVSPFNGNVYMIKQYSNDDMKEIQRELGTLTKLKHLTNGSDSVLADLSGCLFDEDNTFILMNRGIMYSPLGGINPDLFHIQYNHVERKELFTKMALAVNQVHLNSYSHGFVQPDNFFISQDKNHLRLGNFQFSTSLAGSIDQNSEIDQCPYLNLYNLNINGNREKNDLINLIQSFIALDPNIYLNFPQEIAIESDDFTNFDQVKSEMYKQIFNPEKHNFRAKLIKIVEASCEKVMTTITVNQPAQNNFLSSMNLFGSLNSGNLFYSFGNQQAQQPPQTIEKLVTKCNPLSQLYLDVIRQDTASPPINANSIFNRLYSMDIDSFHIKEYKAYPNGTLVAQNSKIPTNPVKKEQSTMVYFENKDIKNKVFKNNNQVLFII